MRRDADLAHIEAQVGCAPDGTFWVVVWVDGKERDDFPPLGPFATSELALKCLREYGESMQPGAVKAGDA